MAEPLSKKLWLSRKEAVIYLESIGCPISQGTIENLAMNNNAGHGPPYSRIRKKVVRYNRCDLDAWALRNTERVE